ncbi:hypothetical protein [Brevibacillus borstelensis]|uniref:hypothetical protein n=1 Tax=Brevibacillus borstelensis TaxID=45462 RepID=UPI0030BF0F3F
MEIENTEEVLHKLNNQIKRLDEAVFNMGSKIELLENLLMKIVGDQSISSELLFDINYIVLKKDLSGLERHEIGFFLIKTAGEYLQEGKVPSLEEFHDKLLQVLRVDQNEKANYPIEISIQLIQKHMRLGDFLVGKEILAKG